MLIRSAARRHYSLVQLNYATAASIAETRIAYVQNFVLNLKCYLRHSSYEFNFIF